MSCSRALVLLVWVLPASARAEGTAMPAQPPAPTAQSPAPVQPAPQPYGPAPYGPPPGYGPPGWYAAPPAYAPPAPNPTVHRHDGFYLRMGLGLGWGYVRSSGTLSAPDGTSPVDLRATYDGWGPAYELLLGGTIARGLVLGGGFVGQDIQSPSLTVSSNSTPELSGRMTVSGSLGVGALGPFLDFYPNDRGGLHFGAMAGLALLGLTNGAGKTSFGFAGALWGGRDFWVGEQWSLGGEARVVGLRASRDMSGLAGTLHDSAISIEVAFTAVYH